MKRFSVVILVLLYLLESGCAGSMALKKHTITPQQAAMLDFGPYPTDYKEIVMKFLRSFLKDPDSAKIEFLDKPVKCVNDSIGNSLPRYGYGGSIQINAKNSYGAYVGYKNRDYIIWNGKVIYYT